MAAQGGRGETPARDSGDVGLRSARGGIPVIQGVRVRLECARGSRATAIASALLYRDPVAVAQADREGQAETDRGAPEGPAVRVAARLRVADRTVRREARGLQVHPGPPGLRVPPVLLGLLGHPEDPVRKHRAGRRGVAVRLNVMIVISPVAMAASRTSSAVRFPAPDRVVSVTGV